MLTSCEKLKDFKKDIYIISFVGNHIDWWRVHKKEFNSVSVPSTCCFFNLSVMFCIYLLINFPLYLRVVTVCCAIDKRWMQIEKSVDVQVIYILSTETAVSHAHMYVVKFVYTYILLPFLDLGKACLSLVCTRNLLASFLSYSYMAVFQTLGDKSCNKLHEVYKHEF